MTVNRILIILSLTLLFCSCSTIRLKSRKGKDFHLDVSSSNKLSGDFKNSKNDTINSKKTLYNNFNYDTVYRQKDLIVNITPIDKHIIKLKLLDNETIIDSLTIKGKYRRGYFKVRRQWSTSFIAGPLLWILGDNLKYIGLTKENKLVIIDSGSGGVMLLVAFPIFAASSGQFENEYERTK
jgi:hypothetical protein